MNTCYKELIEKCEGKELFFFSICSGHVSDFFDIGDYTIVVLEGGVRIISNGINDNTYHLTNKVIEINNGEKFKIQNTHSNTIELYFLKKV